MFNKFTINLHHYLESLGISLLAVFLPIKPVLITVSVLISADLIFGIWAAKKRGEKISSARLRDTIIKFIVYQSACVLGFVVEKYLLDSLLPITKITAGLIGLTEIKSLTENFQDITQKDLFKELLIKLGSPNKIKSKSKDQD